MKDLRDRLYIASFCENYKELIKEYGLGMEINHTCISERLDEDKREDLIRDIEQDITDSCAERLMIHGPFTEIIPAAIDPLMRETGMKRVRQAYEVAEHFGLKKMVVHTGWMPFMYFKSYQAEKGAEFWQEFMAGKPEDFIICVENVLEDGPGMLKDMMAKINDPRIRLCLDVGHANAMTLKEYDVHDWIRELGPYISHVHIHNNDGTDDSHSALGEGAMNMERVLRDIAENCPGDVTYTIEAMDAASCLKWLEEKELI